MKILIVEDNEDIRILLMKQLRAHGHEVITTANGVEALQQALGQPPDIIVSDILMPKMDGYQLCRECKQDEQLKNIPFVFYTATYTLDEDKKFALSLGADAFLVKPTEPGVLVQKLSEIFEKSRSGALARPEVALLKPSLFLAEHDKRVSAKLEDKMAQLEIEITERRQTEKALKERMKELSIIYNTSKIMEGCTDLDKAIHQVVNLIPPAFQFPELACARIIYNGKEYKTGNFKKSEWKQSVIIKITGKKSGIVEVFYLKERPFLLEGEKMLKELASQIENITERRQAEKKLRQSFIQLHRNLEETVNALVSALEMRDPYTAGHQRRVAQLATALAKEMGFPKEQIDGVRMSATVHDVGKISIPAEILSKPGRLTETEFNMIKPHSQTGYDILKAIEFPWPVAKTVLQHHERMDGSGYPEGLSGKDILLEARILGVADVVEAMSSHRPYRPALGIGKALEEISDKSGSLYDPAVVAACLKVFKNGFSFEKEK